MNYDIRTTLISKYCHGMFLQALDTLCLLTSNRPTVNKAKERILYSYNTGIILSEKIWYILMYDYVIQ
jgi:hypothetical protein